MRVYNVPPANSAACQQSLLNPELSQNSVKRTCNFRESPECELRLNGVLRRLMSNCGPQGRSRELMVVPNLLPKVVPHGSRLLPRFIVRIRGRLVARKPPLDPAPTLSPHPSRRLGGPHPGDPGPVAALSQREGLLALRLGAPASLLPETVLPEPVQPQGTGPGARAARVAEGVGRESL